MGRVQKARPIFIAAILKVLHMGRILKVAAAAFPQFQKREVPP